MSDFSFRVWSLSSGSLPLPTLPQPRVLYFSVLSFTLFRLFSPAESVHLTFNPFICGDSWTLKWETFHFRYELTVDAYVFQSNFLPKYMASVTLGRKGRETSVYWTLVTWYTLFKPSVKVLLSHFVVKTEAQKRVTFSESPNLRLGGFCISLQAHTLTWVRWP